MDFKKQYFSSGVEYKKRSAIYKIKNKLFSNKKSKEHYDFLLLDRWGNFKGSKRILDIGCGKCEFIDLNPFKKKVFGLDINPETVAHMRKKGFIIKVGDLTSNKGIPYNKDSFDAVNLSHVLEHLDNPTKAILEIKRVLKNKGKIVIIVPNFSFKRFHDDYTHKKPYTKMSLFRLLNDNSFSEITIKNGPSLNKLIGGLFFFFPRIRFIIEKFFGIFSPSEFIAIARNDK